MGTRSLRVSLQNEQRQPVPGRLGWEGWSVLHACLAGRKIHFLPYFTPKRSLTEARFTVKDLCGPWQPWNRSVMTFPLSVLDVIMPRGETMSGDGKLLCEWDCRGSRGLPTAECGLECPAHRCSTVPEPKTPSIRAHVPGPGHVDPSQGWSRAPKAGHQPFFFHW